MEGRVRMSRGFNGRPVKIGKKVLIVNYDEVTIATHGDWRLVECTSYSQDDWKSLKLYLDRKARKNVWRLGVKGSQMARLHDAGLLEAFYPGVREWVAQQAIGIDAPFPENDQEDKGAAYPVPEKARAFIVETVAARQESMLPWSHKAQTTRMGRYIIPEIREGLKVSENKAKVFIESLLRDGTLAYVMVNKNTRLKGLRVAKQMEIDNG